MDLAERIGKLRVDLLFDEPESEDGFQIECLTPLAEQQYLLAIGHLELAQRFMKMCAYYLARKE